MILYVNGDECTAAAQAVNSFSFANDDIEYVAQGRRPHPDNLAVSWGMTLSKPLGLGFKCQAESDSSNARIIRTTNQFINSLGTLGNPYTVIVIGWSDWTREEWFDDESNEWYQVSTTNGDSLPIKWKVRYKQWISKLKSNDSEAVAHASIRDMHTKLADLKIPHLFFNSRMNFKPQKVDWHGCYVEPYDPSFVFAKWAKANEQGVFGPEAHRRWADVLFSRLTPLLNSV